MIDGVAIRLSRREDTRALARLAALDSAPAPIGAQLVAEVEGALVAAIPLAGGPAIADPFHRTADVLELLSLRAEQLRQQAPARRLSPRAGRRRRRYRAPASAAP